MQKFQDWITQKYIILRGRKLNPESDAWLIGVSGKVGTTPNVFIQSFAEDNNLLIKRDGLKHGLIHSFDELELPQNEGQTIAPLIKRFYEETSGFSLDVNMRWNPWFKPFGRLVKVLYSKRLEQLNFPVNKRDMRKEIESHIISFVHPDSKATVYTLWHRTLKDTGEVMFSGMYSTCELPSGKRCIKATFPLPNGSATVLLEPEALENGALALKSNGKRFGETGFYFTLKDKKGINRARYVRSFHEVLTIKEVGDSLSAVQSFQLWGRGVMEIDYKINPK